MSSDTTSFGDLLRQLRTSAALSQEALAERAGLSLRGISDLERGVRRVPRLTTVGMLANALELGPEDRGKLLTAARPGFPLDRPESALRGFPPFPTPLAALIDRERELAALVSLLGNGAIRLVTLTGAGGSGKTRLALEVGARLRRAFADGAAFIDLAPVRDAALVIPTIASALGVRARAGQPLLDTLAGVLAANEVVLVLDNCEQVLGAAPDIAALLAASPRVVVLATSREPLRVRGERLFSLLPLPLPGDDLPAVEDLACVPAVALFVERAAASQGDFALTLDNAAAVAAICRRLDGLPLAIELAAARARMLPPEAMLARLEQRLSFLTGGARDAPPRQRTMRDAIAWSHDLLAPQEQVLFRRLAVFIGGCSLEAAESVTNLDGKHDLFAGMVALVDHSLLRQEFGPDGEPRFAMLETIREYALERLEESREAASLRARQAKYFTTLAERGVPANYTLTTSSAARQFAAERANMQAALAWEAEQGTTDLLLRLAAIGWWYWEPAEGYRALERALAAMAPTPARRGERALILASMGEIAAWLGYGVPAIELLEESLALAREANDPHATALAQLWLASVLAGQLDLDRAEALATGALARWQAMPDRGRSRIGDTLFTLGYIASLRGDQTVAEACFGEALDLARAHGADQFVALVLECLGTCAREQGNPVRAAKLFAESLAIVRSVENPLVVINCVKSLGAVAAVTGRPVHAARLFGAAEALRERHGMVVEPAEESRLERAVAPARAKLSAGAFTAAWACGHALSMDKAIMEALAVAEEVAQPHPSAAP